MHFTSATMLCALSLFFSAAAATGFLPVFNPNAAVPADAPNYRALDHPPSFNPAVAYEGTVGVKYLMQYTNFAASSWGK